MICLVRTQFFSNQHRTPSASASVGGALSSLEGGWTGAVLGEIASVAFLTAAPRTHEVNSSLVGWTYVFLESIDGEAVERAWLRFSFIAENWLKTLIISA